MVDELDEIALIGHSLPNTMETVVPLSARALAPLVVVLAAVDAVVFDVAEGNAVP